jgi:N-acetyl-1-D-myo-inositol-2-amino-2-deoxy-alpha-D-glucopyranoside deacetylase
MPASRSSRSPDVLFEVVTSSAATEANADLPASRRLLLVHAHPDDETIATGSTMARYAAEGAQVTLVTCTLGELGEILVPELEGLASDRADQLGGYRMSELAAALRLLGVSDQRYLGGAGRWRDSGMMDTPGNKDPRAFWHCASDEAAFDTAVDSLAEIIREVRPQVLVTYDENGAYGHPDHIMAHRVAMAAVDRAADRAHDPAAGVEPGWPVEKVYYTAIPRSVLQHGIDALIASGQSAFFGVERAEDLPMGNDDADVTTAIDGGRWGEAKLAAMRAYPTQISVDGPFFALSNQIGFELLGVEYYRIVRGAVAGSRDADGRETDLFAGVSS